VTAAELIQLLQTVPADAQVDRQDNEFNYFDVNYVGYSKKHNVVRVFSHGSSDGIETLQKQGDDFELVTLK
jgi:hypothetical protein